MSVLLPHPLLPTNRRYVSLLPSDRRLVVLSSPPPGDDAVEEFSEDSLTRCDQMSSTMGWLVGVWVVELVELVLLVVVAVAVAVVVVVSEEEGVESEAAVDDPPADDFDEANCSSWLRSSCDTFLEAYDMVKPADTE